MPGHVPDRCRRCGRPFTPSRPHRTRGLHNGCWTSAWHAGETHLYPRTRNLIDPDAIAELEAAGLDTATIALRLNVTTAGVRQHRRRRRLKTTTTA